MKKHNLPDQSKIPAIDKSSLKFFVIYRIFDLLDKIVMASIYIACFYFSYLAIDALAGKTTITNMVISYFSAKESDFGLPWVVAVLTSFWAILERRERKRKTESMHKHNRELEFRINPDRTSSGLLPTGDTNPKDKIL